MRSRIGGTLRGSHVFQSGETVEIFDQLFFALGSAQITRNDLRLKLQSTILGRSASPHPWSPYGNTTDPRLNLALTVVAMANPTGSAIGSLFLDLRQERLDLDLQRLDQEAPRSLANYLRQCVSRTLRLNRYYGTLFHGVSLSLVDESCLLGGFRIRHLHFCPSPTFDNSSANSAVVWKGS